MTKKLVLLWHDAGGFLEVHKVKDPLLFPLYLSREYAIPYEIVALNSENKRSPLKTHRKTWYNWGK